MKIRILSFDMDGCIFNGDYIRSQDKDVLKHNDAFFKKIALENKAFDTKYTFVGSNRQSLSIDLMNRPFKGSCFPAIKKISDFLGILLDKLLLADIYGDLPDGTSFDRAMDKDYKGDHSEWIFDETKATIIYAQIHKIAALHPNDEIILDFYDDKRQDILEKLNSFYSKYPDLIPLNVTLRLHHYAGGDVTLVNSIKGTGFIDSDYRQTVKDMAEEAVKFHGRRQISVTEVVDPKVLVHRTPLVVAPAEISPSKDDASSDALTQTQEVLNVAGPIEMAYPNDNVSVNKVPTKYITALAAIKVKVDELKESADDLHIEGLPDEDQTDDWKKYNVAANHANILHTALEHAKTNFENGGSKELFLLAANDAISVARDSELKNHRGHAKQIFGYAGLAVLAILTIATAGAAYVAAGVVNYAINRQFFFSTTINTDSINKVEDMYRVINEMASSAA